MSQALTRNGIVFLALLMTSVGGILASGALVSHRGVMSSTVAGAQSPIGAIIALAVFLVIATLIAAAVGRLINAAVGLFVLGFGFSILALRTAPVPEFIFGGGSMMAAGIETVIWSVVLLGLALAVFRLGGPLPDAGPREEKQAAGLLSRESLVCAAGGVLMFAVVWVLARSTTKGQAYGAVFVGATLAGLAGRLVAPYVQPVLLFASPCLVGAIGHFAGSWMLRGTSLDDALVRDALPALCIPMPIDYAAGTLAGVRAFGIGWARSFIQVEESDEAAAKKEPAGA